MSGGDTAIGAQHTPPGEIVQGTLRQPAGYPPGLTRQAGTTGQLAVAELLTGADAAEGQSQPGEGLLGLHLDRTCCYHAGSIQQGRVVE